MSSHLRLPLFTSFALALSLLLSALLTRGPAHTSLLAATTAQTGDPAWIIWDTAAPVQRLTVAGDTLWTGTDTGLWQWNRATGPIAPFDRAAGLPGADVLGIAVAADTTWVALRDAGVARIAADGTISPFELPAGVTSQVWDLAVAGNDLWLATLGSGVLHYDGSNWTTFTSGNSALPADDVYAIAVSSTGQPWIGTLSAGVATLVDATWVTYALPTTITHPLGTNAPMPNNAVVDIAIDENDTPWFATDGSGVLMLDVTSAPDAEWTMYDTNTSALPGNFVQRLQFDSVGNLWIGTLNRGVAQLAPDRTTWTSFDTAGTPLATDAILDLAWDHTGGLWMTAYDIGLAFYGKLPDVAPLMELDPRGQPPAPLSPMMGYTLWLDPATFTWTLGWSSDGDPHSFSGELLADGPISLQREVEGATVADNRLLLNTTATSFGDQVTFTLDRSVTTLTVRLQIDGAYYPFNMQIGRDAARPGTAPFRLQALQPQPPIVVAQVDPLTVDEGSMVWFSGTYTDTDSVTGHTYIWDLGDGTLVTDTLAPSHIYADNGNFDATFTVTDVDGMVGTATQTITVENVAPVVELFVFTDQPTVGESITFSGDMFDSSSADTHTYTWDFGDGNAPVSTDILATTYSYADTGTYTITLTVTDDDGGIGQASMVLEVQPDPATPTATDEPYPPPVTPTPTATDEPYPYPSPTDEPYPYPSPTDDPYPYPSPVTPTATGEPYPYPYPSPVTPTPTGEPYPYPYPSPVTPTPTATSEPYPPPVTVTATPVAACSPNPFGAATAFNGFILGDFTHRYTATEGRLAVGGNATLTSYGLGRGLTAADDNRDTLIVGADLTYTYGQVYHGNIAHGGSANLTGVNLLTGEVRSATPLDFAAAASDLRSRSETWAALPVNGTTSVEPWGAITLTGSDPERNVFTLAGSDLGRATSLTINVPAGATALINIDGTTNQMQYFGVFLVGAAREQVVYNFYATDSLTIAGIGVPGSIVAPNAAITFPNGNLDGMLIGASLEGAGELRLYAPQPCLPESGN